jgi:hypothetical protein
MGLGSVNHWKVISSLDSHRALKWKAVDKNINFVNSSPPGSVHPGVLEVAPQPLRSLCCPEPVVALLITLCFSLPRPMRASICRDKPSFTPGKGEKGANHCVHPVNEPGIEIRLGNARGASAA